MPLLPVMTSEQYWEDAASFRPERFLQENAELVSTSGPASTSFPGLEDNLSANANG